MHRVAVPKHIGAVAWWRGHCAVSRGPATQVRVVTFPAQFAAPPRRCASSARAIPRPPPPSPFINCGLDPPATIIPGTLQLQSCMGMICRPQSYTAKYCMYGNDPPATTRVAYTADAGAPILSNVVPSAANQHREANFGTRSVSHSGALWSHRLSGARVVRILMPPRLTAACSPIGTTQGTGFLPSGRAL